MKRPLTILLVLVLVLAACAPRAPVRENDTPSPQVIAPNFGDADPHPWDGRAPASYPVHGIDIARYQTDLDWSAARAAGVNFAFIKATEGGDIMDPMFSNHWQGAARAGVLPGAYHFFYHCRPASEQARWFIRHVPRTPGALPPVLDMEWTPFSPTCTTRRSPEVIRAEAEVFADIIEEHYGERPILYTTVDFFEDNEMWRVSGVEFWLRSVAGHPRDVYAGRHWTFWQYSGTGLVPGIPGKTDLNVFAGSEQAWGDWLASRRQ